MKAQKPILSFILAALLILGAPCLAPQAQAAGSVVINENNFPDAAFRSYVSENFDTNQSGILGSEERAAATEIDCAYGVIASLKGVEYFTSLERLNCCGNALSELDLSKNTALTELSCQENQLMSLKLGQNGSLRVIHCYDNALFTLDLSGCPALELLWCFGNQLSELDLSKNTALKALDCSCNQFAALDLSHNPLLEEFACEENQIQALDLSKNTALVMLDCSRNCLSRLKLSKNTALQRLSCADNALTVLDLSAQPALVFLACDGNALKSLDLSGHAALESLSCGRNALQSLNLGGCGVLSGLDCAGNPLVFLDLTSCPTLREVYLQGESWDDGEGGMGYYAESGWLFVDAGLAVAADGKPVIYAQPQDVRAVPGAKVEFRVGAYAGTNGSYQWQFKKNASDSWHNCSGEEARGAVYRLTAKSYRSGYQYRCRVTNAEGTVRSAAAVLTVIAQPRVTVQPADVKTVTGETAVFRVAAEGEGLVYQWYYLKSGGSSWLRCSGSGFDTDTLRVEAKSYRSGYRYRCVITNEAGSATSEAVMLTVIRKPVIGGQPADVSAAAGETVSFSVKVTGLDLSYQWYFQKPGETAWPACSEGTARTLFVEAKHYRSGYRYRCRVSNAAGAVTSEAAVLTVR